MFQEKGVELLRRSLIDTLRNPDTKVAAIHDVVPEVRNRLELVNETPEMLRRLQESAFKNEAGEPIIFFTGTEVDYGQDFQQLMTAHFHNLMGPGKYMDDWDVVGGSYAVGRFIGGGADGTSTARVQAFYSLVPEAKTMSMEGFGASDPAGLRYFETTFADDEWVQLNRDLFRDYHNKNSYIFDRKSPWFAQDPLLPETIEIFSEYSDAVKDVWGNKKSFKGVEATFGANASRRLYKNFIEAYADEVRNWKSRTALGRRHRYGGVDTIDEFSETDYPHRHVGDETKPLEDHFEDLLKEDIDLSSELHDSIVTAASIKATARTVAEEVDASKRIGTWGKLGAFEQADRLAAVNTTQRQVRLLDAQQGLLRIEQEDPATYQLIDVDMQEGWGFFTDADDLILDMGNQHLFEVMKSASRNNAGKTRGMSDQLANEFRGTFGMSEQQLADLMVAADMGDSALFSMRNRRIHERMHSMVKKKLQIEGDAAFKKLGPNDGTVGDYEYEAAQTAVTQKWLDIYNLSLIHI